MQTKIDSYGRQICPKCENSVLHRDCLAEAVFASPIDYGDYCRFHWTEKKKFWKGIWPPIKVKNYSRKDPI